MIYGISHTTFIVKDLDKATRFFKPYINSASSGKQVISKCWVHKFYQESPIEGAIRFSRVWAIPKDAVKLIDPR